MSEKITTNDLVEVLNQLSNRLLASASELISSENHVDKIIAATMIRVARCVDDVVGEAEG